MRVPFPTPPVAPANEGDQPWGVRFEGRIRSTGVFKANHVVTILSGLSAAAERNKVKIASIWLGKLGYVSFKI